MHGSVLWHACDVASVSDSPGTLPEPLGPLPPARHVAGCHAPHLPIHPCAQSALMTARHTHHQRPGPHAALCLQAFSTTACVTVGNCLGAGRPALSSFTVPPFCRSWGLAMGTWVHGTAH